MTIEISKALKVALDTAKSFGPVAEPEIAQAESTLGLSFPPSYRAFLQIYGASLGKAPFELAGLPQSSDPEEGPLFTNAVHLTRAARRASHGGFPSAYVVVSSDGQDEIYCIDTATTKDGESPVVAVGPRRSGEVASSFAEFVAKVFSNGAV